MRRVVRKVLKCSRKMCFSCGFLGEVVSTKVWLPTAEGTNCSDTLRLIGSNHFYLRIFFFLVRLFLKSSIFKPVLLFFQDCFGVNANTGPLKTPVLCFLSPLFFHFWPLTTDRFFESAHPVGESFQRRWWVWLQWLSHFGQSCSFEFVSIVQGDVYEIRRE